MKYVPKTEQELDMESLLPEDIYDFNVIEVDDKPSKKGNDMITLKLRVFGHNGEQQYVYDYIAFGNSFGERKFRHAANACRLIELYSSGNLTAYDFLNTSGRALVKQQKGTPDFPSPKNIIGQYIPHENGNPVVTRPTKEIIDDDIPF